MQQSIDISHLETNSKHFNRNNRLNFNEKVLASGIWVGSSLSIFCIVGWDPGNNDHSVGFVNECLVITIGLA